MNGPRWLLAGGIIAVTMLPLVRTVAAMLIAAMVCAAPTASSQRASGREWPVGSRTRRLVPEGTYNWRGATTRALVTSLWYPAVSGTSMSEHDIGPAGSPLFRLGVWADDGEPASGPFPLIVLSHGTGGSAQMMAWLARALASHGYVVAAVNHPGNNALEEYTPEGFLLWWERARDLTVVIDMLIADAEFGRIVDPRRIGAAGFSLGGYTVIEVAGGRTDPALFRKFCRSAEAEGCIDPPEFPNLFARWDQLETTDPAFRRAAGRAGRSFRDPRVRAVFAIAPALGRTFIADSLRRIAIPVSIVAGADDRIVPITSNARYLARLIPGTSLTLLAGGVGHYTFLAPCTPGGQRTQPQLCTEASGLDRPTIHRRTADHAVQFFDNTLK